jgi:hypothetical protein
MGRASQVQEFRGSTGLSGSWKVAVRQPVGGLTERKPRANNGRFRALRGSSGDVVDGGNPLQ